MYIVHSRLSWRLFKPTWLSEPWCLLHNPHAQKWASRYKTSYPSLSFDKSQFPPGITPAVILCLIRSIDLCAVAWESGRAPASLRRLYPESWRGCTQKWELDEGRTTSEGTRNRLLAWRGSWTAILLAAESEDAVLLIASRRVLLLRRWLCGGGHETTMRWMQLVCL